VRGISSPFINLNERGRDTPHPSPLPLLPRKDLLDEAAPALLVGVEFGDTVEFAYFAQHRGGELAAAE
jgi:hypothetical protein